MLHKIFTARSHVNRESENNVNFSDRVEKLRKTQRLTVKEVFQLVGISPAMMSMIRSGTRNPSIKMERRLESAELAAGLATPAPPAAPPPVFQPLEKRGPDFPNLGKPGDDLPAIRDELQRLLARVERMIEEKKEKK